MTPDYFYTAGERINLVGGPRGGEQVTLTAGDAERRYIPLAIGYAGPRHPADPKDGASKTPVFDKALGFPTPEPGMGYYEPTQIKHVWKWTIRPVGARVLHYHR